MRLQQSLLAAVVSYGLVVGFFGDAQAAPINFGPGGTGGEFINSDSINLGLGPVVYAVSGSVPDQTVNVGTTPVTFKRFATSPDVSITSAVTFYDAAIGGTYTVSTDQVALDEVLNSGAFSSDSHPIDMTLKNLVVGRKYRVQLIGAADTRAGLADITATVASIDGGTVGDISRFQDPNADLVKHVLIATGDFTASATTQGLTLNGSNLRGAFSAVIVTTVPEPTTLVLLGVAGIAVHCAARRRQ